MASRRMEVPSWSSRAGRTEQTLFLKFLTNFGAEEWQTVSKRAVLMAGFAWCRYSPQRLQVFLPRTTCSQFEILLSGINFTYKYNNLSTCRNEYILIMKIHDHNYNKSIIAPGKSTQAWNYHLVSDKPSTDGLLFGSIKVSPQQISSIGMRLMVVCYLLGIRCLCFWKITMISSWEQDE